MLQQTTHIEGLANDFQDVDLRDDTKPGVTLVEFFVESEEMPALTEKEGRVVRKNFVWIRQTVDLGNLIVLRRINDTVEFNDKAGKWEVRKLLPGMLDEKTPASDIRRNPGEWNAFMRGVSSDSIGAPLSLLFKGDPTRVHQYKARHIHTIEQLAACGAGEAEQLGLGAKKDIERAREYLERLESQAPGLAMQSKFDEQAAQIAKLAAQNQDLTEKLTELLRAQLEGQASATAPKRGGRPKKTETQLEAA